MSVFNAESRRKVDRVAAIVGAVAFLAFIGIIALTTTSLQAPAGPTAISTTVASTSVPGDPMTMTVTTTTPPYRATNPPVVTKEVTTVEGNSGGSVVVTTSTQPPPPPFLGSLATGILFEVFLAILLALLLAFATQRVLLGEYGFARSTGGDRTLPAVDVDEAATIKADIGAAAETADLSRPLYEKAGVTDARLRLLQSGIALELDVRKLAQDNDLPGGLSVQYVVRGLIEKGKMSEKLALGISALSSIADRLARGADLSQDSMTLLADSYAQALAKVGGKIKRVPVSRN